MEKWKIEQQRREAELQKKLGSRVMISLEEARSIILGLAEERFKNSSAEEVPLDRAGGRVLDHDLVSSENVPSFSHALLDGYALRAVETKGASPSSPAHFAVIATVPAGEEYPGEVKSQSAVRILTGAPVPQGVDAVIREEEVGRDGDNIFISRPLRGGEGIAPRGEEIRVGETILEGGETLSAFHLGLLAFLGIDPVKVIRRPRVGIFCTGSELVPVRSKKGTGQIRVSNFHTLAELIRSTGGVPIDLGIAPDNLEEICSKVQEAEDIEVDLLLSTGGAASGDYDLLLEAMEKTGFQYLFWKVAFRPGAPAAAGLKNNLLWIGLSGNPTGAAVMTLLTAVPFTGILSGRGDPLQKHKAILTRPLISKKGMRSFWWGYCQLRAGKLFVDFFGGQECSMVKSYLNSNCLIEIPPGEVSWEEGSTADIWVF